MTPSELRQRQEFLARAEEYCRTGLYDKAHSLARKRLSRFSGDIDAWLIIALCWAHGGKLREASEVLKELDEIRRGWSRIYRLLGNIYQTEELDEEAAELYRKARALGHEEGIPEVMGEKISANGYLYHHGDDTQGDAEIIKNISSDFYTITLAELYTKQGHLTMARDVLKRIVKEEPHNVKAIERLEFVEASMGAEKREKRKVVTAKLEKWLHTLHRRRAAS